MTVRWRLTLIATLAFAIAISAAAFGLVRVVHNHLSDAISANTQRQLDDAAAQLQATTGPPGQRLEGARAQQLPDGSVVLYVSGYGHPPQGAIFEAKRRVGDVVLVAQESLAEVDSTTHTLTTLMLIVVPILIALVALAAWYFTGRALKPVEAIRAEAESITGSTMHRRVPEPDTD